MIDATQTQAPEMVTPDSIYAAMNTLMAVIRGAESLELAQEAATMSLCLGAQALQDIAGRVHARAVLEFLLDKLNQPGRLVSTITTH